jgi:hypothetical protein
MRTALTAVLVATAFAVGLAHGQDRADDLEQRLAAVRREVKVLDFDTTLERVPGFVARETAYGELLDRMAAGAASGKDITPLLKEGRAMKEAALEELNRILKLHRGKYTGLTEEEVWTRLRNARLRDVHYENEWLVNILDDIEASAEINIEVDARVYKFDTVSFDFESTSARAMLQMMGDSLLFNWVVHDGTLYVYKERHEILFGGDWIRQKKAAWKAQQEALEAARKEAEKRALEGDGAVGGDK